MLVAIEKKYLRNHIAWVHEGKKPNVCNSCNRCFLEIEELKEHNLKEHCKKSKAKDLETLKANNLAYAQSQFQINAKKSKTNNHHQSLPTIEDSQEIQK